MKLTFVLLASFLLCSCLNKDSKATMENSQLIHAVGGGTTKLISKTDSISDLPEMNNVSGDFIDIFQIKENYRGFSTSSILNRERSWLYDKPIDDGYYGAYCLIKRFDDGKVSPLIDRLVVFNYETPWMYDNLSDRFIEITVHHPGIKIFKEIGVGADVSILNKYLSNFYQKNDELVIYVKEDVNLVGLFKVKNNKISWYRIGYYSTDIVSNIESYIPLLLE
ncbi:hypothetical protein [Bacteroides sp. 51]|uniref:hypothetical protein n=1 Tax=Bacteroides sp. 51 TaxID=2302938 RepID=UPI0013D0C7AF|nr:hypothetical protein [Bacteroides sp. 51]NDV82999.1 hypothetical protein [Bacteroides sp. 51]